MRSSNVAALVIGLFLPQITLANDTSDCYSAMWKLPTIQGVVAKMQPTGPGEAIKARVNAAKANAKEREALAVLLDEMLSCQKVGEAGLSQYPPEAQKIVRTLQTDSNALLTRLYAGRISWGEFAEGKERVMTEFANAKADLDARLEARRQFLEEQKKKDTANLAAMQAAEAERSASAAQAEFAQRQRDEAQLAAFKKQQEQQNFLSGLQMLNAGRPQFQPMPAPSFGVQCRSRQVGNQIYTDCN